MRLPLLLGLLPVLASCSEGAQGKDFQELASAPRVARTQAVSLVQPLGGANVVALDGAAVPAASPLASAPVGHLEGPDRLAHLFQRFATLDEGRGHDDVRILQFGDSHTASDMGATAFRHVLQTRFGDGGRGFVSVGCPWKNYVQEGIRGCWMNDEFEPQRARPRTPLGFGVNTTGGMDGDFGLLGVGIGASHGGAYASTQIGERFSRFEVAYLEEPFGGSFDVLVDNLHVGRVSTRAATGMPPSSGFTSFAVTDGPHQIDVRTVGDGGVRVFGMGLDRPQVGVVVTALGINGAQIFTPLRSSEDHFEEQVRHQAPALVVLAYGTNEAADPNLDDATYEHGLVDLLGRVSRAAPSSACLLLGPPDFARWTRGSHGYHTTPRILEVDAIQKRVARAAGCAFYDQIDAMGGSGSMAAWAAEQPAPRAQQDRMHLTRAGYTQVGTSFATDVLHAYDEWRAETGLPPTGAEKPWDVAGR